MSLIIVSDKPENTGTIADIRIWMRSEETRAAWVKQNPSLGVAFCRYMAGQEVDDVRRVFDIEPVCQLKEDSSVRGRGINLFALKDFEDALWVGFTVIANRQR